MAEKEMPRLMFTEEWDEYAADLAEMKGWCGIGVVELPDGRRIPVDFYHPARLASDLESRLKEGKVYVAEPHMIVIPEVTREYMEKAVQQLYESGYFKRL
jgi:hypothetical protein